jgi:hypothetical protein
LAAISACSSAAAEVKIISFSGDVKIRYGVEESWHPAAAGMMMREIDTILTGEASAVVLEMSEGTIFRLGSHAILDIADLRKITEREMFLFLMSQKVNQIPERKDKTPLRIGNVSVVHGESKAGSPQGAAGNESQAWSQEINGARALYDQHYYPNAVVKLHKILIKYPAVSDCGEIHFHLGKAFEALSKSGQANDAYHAALERIEAGDCENAEARKRAEETRQALERLKL